MSGQFAQERQARTVARELVPGGFLAFIGIGGIRAHGVVEGHKLRLRIPVQRDQLWLPFSIW